VTLARKWYAHEGVDAIFDVNHSAIALAINGLVAKNGRVVINTGAGSVGLTNEGCTANAVHYVYDTYALATGAAQGMARLGGSQSRSWYILDVDYAFGKLRGREIRPGAAGTGRCARRRRADAARTSPCEGRPAGGFWQWVRMRFPRFSRKPAV
jgi:branched-chain amino acid transport system substrate-binding protein